MNELQGLSKDELVEKYTPLIRSIAAQIRSRLSVNLEFDELVSYGRLGLLEASERFDYTLGVSFKTFAYYRIKGAIYDGLRKMEVITRRKDPRLKFEEAANHLIGNEALKRSTEPHSLKDDIEELRGVISSLVPVYFLSNDSLEQLSSPQGGQSAEEHAMFNQEKSTLRNAMQKLSQNERELLQYYYYQDCTLEEAASKLGLSKSWASRIHARALTKLKGSFKSTTQSASRQRTRS
jgi:RNA polymerase sigma factor for flagellar operon FliA